MAQFFRSLLGNFEVSLLKVSEQITPLQIFHHNVDVILIFKNIQ